MYQDVFIHPEQRKLQHAEWKAGAKETMKTYELIKLIYGTTSVLFMATRTFKQLAADERKKFPLS